MVVGRHRNTKIIIDTQAVVENVQNELKRLPNQSELFAVVKANGYGHGAVEIAKAAKKAGATGFCVAILDEAIELRGQGIKDPILILGVLDRSSIMQALEYDLSVTVATLEWLVEAIKQLTQRKLNNRMKLHIKLDTGMGRLGFTETQSLKSAIELIRCTNTVELEGVFTHFATADSLDETYFIEQSERFTKLLSKIDPLPNYIHSGNSAAALWHPSVGNMVRFGIAMYGLNPSGTSLPSAYPLKPALQLYSEIIQVKRVAGNESIGYGGTYRTQEAEWIGTIPIGYADGWLRHLQGFFVLVAGQQCEIIGRICMDQCMVRLPKKVSIGEKVTLIGKDGSEEITLQMVADYLQTIHYEVACTFSERIPREYR